MEEEEEEEEEDNDNGGESLTCLPSCFQMELRSRAHCLRSSSFIVSTNGGLWKEEGEEGDRDENYSTQSAPRTAGHAPTQGRIRVYHSTGVLC